MDEAMRQEMVAAYKRGWSLIPLKNNDKRPNLPIGHKFLERKATKEEYKKFNFGNYGIVCGELSGICVLDIDKPEGFETLARLELDTVINTETPHVWTPNGMHVYFKWHPDVQTRGNVVGEGVDIRSTGSYVVGPGSSINGERYVWDGVHTPDTPLTAAPTWMARGGGEYTDPQYWKMPEKVAEGGRNNKLTSLAGALVLREIPHEIMVETLRYINRIWFEPPLPDSEVLTIAQSIERRRNA